MSTIEWNPRKAISNLQKHGITFPEAISALEDTFALTYEDDDPRERRFVTLGMNDSGKLLIVVYVFRGDSVRLISARRATARERRIYETGVL